MIKKQIRLQIHVALTASKRSAISALGRVFVYGGIMRSVSFLFMALCSSSVFAANEFKIITDPMSDAKRGIAAINVGGKITPVVKCDKNGTGSLYVSFIADKYLGATRYKYRNIKVRFDGAQPYELAAYHDGRTASVFELKPGSSAGRLLTDMMQGKEMVVQLTTYDYETVTDVFALGDAASIIDQAVNACNDANWKTAGV